jgi:microcystin-dependent protein
MAGPTGRTPIGGYPYPIPDDTVDAPRDVEALARAIDGNASAIIVGEVRTFGLAAAPPRWLLCNGAAYEQADFPELFAAVGGLFSTGGESPTQFRVPDVAGRAICGAGQGEGVTPRATGARWGEEAHTLTTAEMPVHAHGGVTNVDNQDHAHYTSGDTGTDYPDHAHGTGGASADHVHGVNNLHPNAQQAFLTQSGVSGPRFTSPGAGYSNTGGRNADHTHGTYGANARHWHGFGAWSGGASARHNHNIPVEGGGAAHSIAQPSVALLVCIYAGRTPPARLQSLSEEEGGE